MVVSGFTNSLSFRQAMRAIVVALFVGLFMAGYDLYAAIERGRSDLQTLSERLFRANVVRAASALFTQNESLGLEIADSAAAFDGIAKFELLDSEGRALAKAEADETKVDPAFLGIGAYLLRGSNRFERSVTTDDLALTRRSRAPVTSTQLLGMMVISFDPGFFGRELAATALELIFIGIIRALLIGIALAFVFQSFVTQPLVRLGHQVLSVRLDAEEPEHLPQPSNHPNDELGYLVRRMNILLDRLGSSQRELRRMATRDSLTGLPNRTMMLELIGSAIERAAKRGNRVIVIMIDLDRFKQVNDSLGHEVGDALLVTAGERLRAAVRSDDAVGRLGGDEFLVVAEEQGGEQDVTSLLKRLRDAIDPPFQIRGHRLHIAASIGVSIAPTHSNDANTLMRQADTAMHVSKQMGGNAWAFFSIEMTEQVAVRLATEGAIRKALENSEFELFLQPKIEARTGRVCGAEALIRWRRQGQIVMPSEFIPIAEQTGLIAPVGDWVFGEACRIVAEWRNRVDSFHVAVNVSARQIDDPGFIDRIVAMIHAHGIKPGEIEIEITESEVMKRVEHYSEFLVRLRQLGIRIAVDDFGTGYSNLAYLKQLPIDVLKIDGSFVRHIPDDVVIASMVIGLAEQLSLETCAEGVESGLHANWLKGSGCTFLQGYLFSKPVNVAEFESNFLAPRSV